MPGKKDRDDKNASFLTGGTKNRSAVTAADANLDGSTTIDLSRSPAAAGNSIFIIPSRTAGTGTISLELWRRMTAHSPAYTAWMVVGTSATQATDTEVRFTGLVAAEYKIKVTALTAGATWDVYEFHSEA